VGGTAKKPLSVLLRNIRTFFDVRVTLVIVSDRICASEEVEVEGAVLVR